MSAAGMLLGVGVIIAIVLLLVGMKILGVKGIGGISIAFVGVVVVFATIVLYSITKTNPLIDNSVDPQLSSLTWAEQVNATFDAVVAEIEATKGTPISRYVVTYRVWYEGTNSNGTKWVGISSPKGMDFAESINYTAEIGSLKNDKKLFQPHLDGVWSMNVQGYVGKMASVSASSNDFFYSGQYLHCSISIDGVVDTQDDGSYVNCWTIIGQ